MSYWEAEFKEIFQGNYILNVDMRFLTNNTSLFNGLFI